MTLLLALLSPVGCTLPTPVTYDHQNLLLLSIDTLRRDGVGRYSGNGDTPFLDDLAKDGLALDAHHACSNWTFGAIVCALSGADGVDAGFVPTGGRGDEALPTDMELLPGLLRSAGFRSALVSTNSYVGTTAKLDRYYDFFEQQSGAAASVVVSAGLQRLPALQQSSRWMLHLHFYDPHSPYAPPRIYLEGLEDLAPINYDLDKLDETQRLDEDWDRLGEDARALIQQHLDVRYRGSVRFLDDELARLYAALQADGVLDDTLVVVFSDHGEQFFKYGHLEHGKTLHGVEVDTFALFSGPGVTPEAWGEPTTHADITPTTLSLLGLNPDALAPTVDLGGVGAVVGTADPERPLFATQYSASQSTRESVDQGDKRLIYHWDGRRELYDLSVDPDEQDDIFAADPDGRAMWDLLLPRVQALDTRGIAVLP